MTIMTYVISLLPLVGGVIGYIIKSEIDRRYLIESEITKQNLQRELEAEKTRQQIKFKADLIAELLAEWISNPTELTKLNQLSYLAFLWLPDDIALELSALLAKTTTAKSVPSLVAKVRKHLLGQTAIGEEHIITFLNKERNYKTLPENIVPTRTAE